MTDTAQKSKAISVYALFGVTIVLTLISNAAVMQLAAPCIDGFIAANKAVLIKSMLITALLPLLYIGWRFVYGASRALKKQRIDNPYKWI